MPKDEYRKVSNIIRSKPVAGLKNKNLYVTELQTLKKPFIS